ncbi:MAG: response regulator [Deltaproteobacteria bacterium]|nr:MAG: response regulator [Deltaproteobacteria bacterium]
MINDLLDLSKLDAGKIDWTVREADVAELIEHVASVARGQATEKGVALEVNLASELPPVFVDSDRIVQVLTNLVGNAMKFTDAGGRIEIAAERSGEGKVLVRVSDTGIGIAPEDQEKIFERFKQIGDVLTDRPQGTGLGLPICKEIVQYHGGKIWVESEPGQGSTFCFTIPAAQQVEERHVAQAPPPEAVAADDRPVILVVDDDAATRQVVRYLLEDEGYHVIEAASGEEALEVARRRTPSLVTLDVMMPDMSGWDVLRVLREDGDLRSVPVLLLSVLAGREHSEHALKLGANAVLSKPVDETELLAAVNKLLRPGDGEVLIIDSDLAQSATIKTELARQGYSVVQAFDARTGLEFARRYGPGLIILGANHRGGAGKELLRQLRSNPVTEAIPVLLVTAAMPEHMEAVYFASESIVESASGPVGDLLATVVKRCRPAGSARAAAVAPEASGSHA